MVEIVHFLTNSMKESNIIDLHAFVNSLDMQKVAKPL